MTASHVFLWSSFNSLFELWLWDILGEGTYLIKHIRTSPPFFFRCPVQWHITWKHSRPISSVLLLLLVVLRVLFVILELIDNNLYNFKKKQRPHSFPARNGTFVNISSTQEAILRTFQTSSSNNVMAKLFFLSPLLFHTFNIVEK